MRILKKYKNDPVYILSKSLDVDRNKLDRILKKASYGYSGYEWGITSEIMKLRSPDIYTIIDTMYDPSKYKYPYNEEWIKKQNFARIPEHEDAFEKSGKCAYFYSKFVLQNRFENESDLFSNKGDCFWLYEYYKRFFSKEEILPEIQHNIMIFRSLEKDSSSDAFHSKEYLKEATDRIEKKQDCENTKLIKEVFLEFICNNDKTKNIPKDQLQRCLRKLLWEKN